MNKIDQILAYIKSISEMLNAWRANAKKVEELPEMVTVNSEALMMVSELEEGVWTSKKLEIQKIIDGISLAGQNNTVREVLLGEITAEHDLEYLFDNNAISVSPTELVILIVQQTISGKQIQRQFLWKLGKGDFAPIGYADLTTKVLELQPKYINEIIADELTSAPDAIVYDFGTITVPIIDVINVAIPSINLSDDEKIYYIRFTQDEIQYLYNFIGTNGSYGDSTLQMDMSDLVLVYSSAVTDVVSLIQSISNFYLSGSVNDASGNKAGSIYRPGKMGIGTPPLVGKLEILIENLYSTNIAAVLNGVIGFGNDSATHKAPTIFGRSNDSIGLSFISGTNDINGTDDMRWDIRQNDNTDFDTLTGGGFRWSRYNVDLMQLLRNGMLKIFGLAGSGSRVVEADSTGVLSATRSLDDYYTKTEVDTSVTAAVATANAYTDSKVSSVYKPMPSVANFAALPSTGNSVGDVRNVLDTGMNYVWIDSGVWDALGTTVDISSKEDTSNKKTTMTGNESSNVFYLSAKGVYDWATGLFQTISGLASAVLAVTLSGLSASSGTFTSSDSIITAFGKIKYLIDNIATTYQAKDNQIEVSSSGNVQNAWHGQTVLFTVNCTITVPSTLNNSLDFVFRTLAGVTVTWAITSPFTWETTPGTTPEKTTGHFMRRGSTNTIILDM